MKTLINTDKNIIRDLSVSSNQCFISGEIISGYYFLLPGTGSIIVGDIIVA